MFICYHSDVHALVECVHLQHVNLSRRFHEIMMEYSQVQEEYRDKTKLMMQRQLQITSGKRVSEADVDEMIEKGNMKVFTQDVSVPI